jgi:hypothetical protein
MAPVGDMFATDCAKTSGKLSVFRRNVLAPAASVGSPALEPDFPMVGGRLPSVILLTPRFYLKCC